MRLRGVELLVVFACHSASSPGFQITVSGEDLAQVGYEFGSGSTANGDPPAFVDGWAVHFTHVIVTIDEVTLAEDPDKDPSDPTVVGPVVAKLAGPFAVDVTIGGTVHGKSGSPEERAVALGTIATKSDGTSFDSTKRYAFGFKIVPASAAATHTNLDSDGDALYAEAIAKGWATIIVGEAEYKGPTPTGDFAKIPTQVAFKLGLANPSLYLNCENTDLQEVGGSFPRGAQPSETEQVTVQITMHTDHLFWSKLNVESTELHFDPIAANARQGVVQMADLDAVDFFGFKMADGTTLNPRSNVSDWKTPAGPLSFDPNGTTFTKANSFSSYLRYAAASGGHMNADGACAIKNDFVP